MANNPYDTPIPFNGQSTQHSKVVIDTAITVWMQMGLTEDQILYGIAMMNVESGYFPTKTNGVPTDTIRGLGQFNTATWNSTAQSFDAQHGLQFTPVPRIYNPDFNPQLSQGTNAPAGESNDSAAGVYDPNGLVAQLEVVGQGIIQEWQLATSLADQAVAQELYSKGVKDASLLVPASGSDSGSDPDFLSTVALAYLNHHQGAGWIGTAAKIPRFNNIQKTINALNTTSLANALKQVVRCGAAGSCG